jgi:hypothetical protein
MWQAEDHALKVVQLLVVLEARPHIFIEAEKDWASYYQTVCCCSSVATGYTGLLQIPSINVVCLC